jgi:hypothetical protein
VDTHGAEKDSRHSAISESPHITHLHKHLAANCNSPAHTSDPQATKHSDANEPHSQTSNATTPTEALATNTITFSVAQENNPLPG